MTATRSILISSATAQALAIVHDQVVRRQEFYKKHNALHEAQEAEMEALLESSGVNALKAKHKAQCAEMVDGANAEAKADISKLLEALGENALSHALQGETPDALVSLVSLDASHLEDLNIAVLEVPAEFSASNLTFH